MGGQKITEGGFVPDDSWLKRSTSGFRRTKASKDVDKYNMQMRLSINSIGYRPVANMGDHRPHTAAVTAQKNTSEGVANLLLQSRPVTAHAMTAKSVEYYVHPSMKPEAINFEPTLPKFVQTDKVVLRFYGYFSEDRVWDGYSPLGNATVEKSLCRLLTIYFYMVDDTVEMIETKQPNSGLKGGCFFRRDALLKDDGSRLEPIDLLVGSTVRVLSRKINITDADVFTREYFSREYDITLEEPMSRPDELREDLGAQYATGLVTAHIPKTDHHGIRSTNYFDNKKNIQRSKQFLSFDGRTLRFQSIEVDDLNSGIPKELKPGQKRYLLLYFLTNNTIETRLMKFTKTNVDDATVVLRRCELPRNWRDVHENDAKPIFYQPEDMICGNVIDCYGRFFLLVSCDEHSKKISREIGLPQRDITIAPPAVDEIRHSIPKLGDMFLAIGNEEDTLRTVHHAPKPKKISANKKIEINHGKFIRARVNMIDNDTIQKTRTFLLSFYLEDDTLQIFEEAKYNSGIDSGRFLKRGKYNNDLPPDRNSPRRFLATDMFLSNVVCVGGAKFQIVEMDSLSMKICEDRPNEFPMFDAFRVASMMLPKTLKLSPNLRSILSTRIDKDRVGYLSKEKLMSALEVLKVTSHLNDQELLTICRRVKDSKEDKYYYHEICDLLSHLARVERTLSREANVQKSMLMGSQEDTPKDELLDSLRCRRVQWRRTFRKDPRSRQGFVTLPTLVAILRRQGIRLSRANIELFRDNYQTHEARGVIDIKDLDQPPLFENKVSNTSVSAKTFTKGMIRPDFRSSSRLMRTTMVGVSVKPWREVGVNERSPKKDVQTQRKEVMTSVLRESLKPDEIELDLNDDMAPETDDYGFEEANYLDERDIDENYVIIDYNALCNDIYE